MSVYEKRLKAFTKKLKVCYNCRNSLWGKMTVELRRVALLNKTVSELEKEAKKTKNYIWKMYRGRLPLTRDPKIDGKVVEVIRPGGGEVTIAYITYRKDLWCTRLNAFIYPPEGIANVCPFYRGVVYE